MVYCSSCGTANRDGSRFCNDCGAKLPSGTSVRCPQCGTPNSPADTFCEKCGTRLVPTLADDAPEPEPPVVPLKKGLSLPTKPDADASPTSADWLGQLRSSLDSSAETEAADSSPVPPPAAALDDVPDWLTSLGIVSGDNPTPAADEDAPAWLSQLPLNSVENSNAEASDTTDWLSNLRAATPVEATASADEDVPEWLRALGTGPLSSPQPEQSAAPAAPDSDEEEIPEWLRTLGTGPLPSAVEPTPATPVAPAEPAPAADWLSGLRASAPSIEPELTVESPSEETPPADQAATPKELPDWLRNLGAADHSQHSTDELPDWLDSLGAETAPSEASTAEPETSDEDDVPAWLRDLGASAMTQPTGLPQADLSAAESSDWMSSLRATADQPLESSTEPLATEEDMPDWLQSMGLPASAEATAPVADDTSDWMSALRATSQAAETPEPTSEPVADDVPEWLQSLGASAQPSAPVADEVPDWMSVLRATPQSAETPEPTSEPTADDVPDWLQAVGMPASAEASAPAADDTSDWMSALRATSQSTETPESTSEPVADEVPDWLQAVGMPASVEESEPVAADDTSDWMSALRATSQSAETPESTSEPVADDVPDWMQSLGLPASAETQPPAPAADDTSDWMSALRATSQAAETPEPTSEPVADDVPDWLQAVGLPASAEASAPAADDTSDWMSALRATSQAAETPKPTSEPVADDVPDWLQAVGMPASAEASAPVADETPDWMSALRATSQSAETPEPTSEPTGDDVPDWLRNFDEPTARSGVAESPVSSSTADDIPDWLRDVGTVAVDQPAQTEPDEVPDWLQTTSTVAAEPAATIEPTNELPDWLSGLQMPEPAASAVSEPVKAERFAESPLVAPRVQPVAERAEDQPVEPAAIPAELPEWLKSLREGKAAAPVQSVEPTPGLTQAEIPSWLEALRPKEGPTTSVADLAAEAEQEEGVFAGLANVLAPLPSLSEVPAPVVSDVTGPSADDLARAGIFQELLTRPISRPTAVASLTTVGKPAQRRILQWGIAILLLAVVVAPFLELTQGLPFLPQADRLPPSALVQAAVTRITVLPPNANVLVVFDYEPTQAGEMNRIAEVMLRHLQTRAANITAVSLNPLGADLAASLWASMGVPVGDPHHNLGYVPGQAIGVQNVLLNNGPFDLVIALSASSDSLRWWVEQIAVGGFNVPLIAGVSAAVESLALPYAHSGQVTGLVSGATGAMMYAQQAELLPSLQEALRAKQSAVQTQQPPSVEVVRALRNQVQIEAQSLAHWLLAILIVIGLVSGLVARVGRRSTP